MSPPLVSVAPPFVSHPLSSAGLFTSGVCTFTSIVSGVLLVSAGVLVNEPLAMKYITAAISITTIIPMRRFEPPPGAILYSYYIIMVEREIIRETRESKGYKT